MIRQCFLAKTGIQFCLESFKEVGLDPSTLYPIVTPRPPALKPSIPLITNVKASGHAVEPTDATLTDESHGLLTTVSESTFKSEEDEELADAQCKIYDQLKLAWGWWILEILPLRHHVQNRNNLHWKSYWQYVVSFSRGFICHSTRACLFVLPRMNLGHPRRIPGPIRERKEKIYVHRSVKIRMEAEGLEGGKYKPKAKFEDLDYEWVD